MSRASNAVRNPLAPQSGTTAPPQKRGPDRSAAPQRAYALRKRMRRKDVHRERIGHLPPRRKG